MKKLILIILVSFTFFNVKSQSITPLQNSEQCPNINITFTVTLPAQSIQSVQPWAINVNPIVVQQPYNIVTNSNNIIFNFIGKFYDDNDNQTFRFFYTDLSGNPKTWDATFIKIKSLLTPNPYSQVSPAPSIITAERCQVQDFNITFPNVQYGNIFVQPPLSYGTITNYQYLLPIGWKLNNGSPSDGVTWQPGISENTTVNIQALEERHLKLFSKFRLAFNQNISSSIVHKSHHIKNYRPDGAGH